MKAVVIIRGGLVSQVLIDDQAIEVAVIDHDVEDVDPTELTTIPNIGDVYAYVGEVTEFAPEKVSDIFKAIKK